MIAIVDDRIDVMQLDAAHAHRIELDAIHDDRSTGRRRPFARFGTEIDSEPGRVTAVHRDRRRARVEQEPDVDAVDRTLENEVSVSIGIELRRGTLSHRSAAVAPTAQT